MFEPHTVSHRQTEDTTPQARLRELIAPEKGDLWLVAFYSLATGILGLGIPIAVQALVNNIAFGNLRQPLVVLTGMVFLTLVFLALLRSLRLIVVEMLQRRIFVRVARTSTQRLLEMGKPGKQYLPELVNRFFDVVTVQKSTSFLLLDGLGILLQTLTGMLLIAFYHPWLLGFDLVLLASFLFVILVLGRRAIPTSIQESHHKYVVAAWLEEIASHPHTFKPLAGLQHAQNHNEKLVARYLSARKQHFQILLRQNVGAFSIQAIGSSALLGLGGWLVIEGQLTLGQLVAAELVVAGVLDNFSKLGKHFETYYDLLAALDKLGYLFDLPGETKRIAVLPKTAAGAAIEMRQVKASSSVAHFSCEQFVCRPGERIAILGANSPAAELFCELLYGLQICQQGLILIDELPLGSLEQGNLRSQVSWLQKTEPLPGSVLDNLRLYQRQLSYEEAQRWLKSVDLWERILNLPQNLETPLGARGAPLSPSETQRLLLARHLAAQPRLLMLNGTLDQIDWNHSGPVTQHLLENVEPSRSLIVFTNQENLMPLFDRHYILSAEGELRLLNDSEDLHVQI
ncbi:MAG: ABC transporter transmembrane domain-containing protein [Candidatus Sericytochromatia bacterium]